MGVNFMRFQLNNGQQFYIEDLNNEFVQNAIRTIYVKKHENRALCLCNPNQPLKLVIAKRRYEKEEKFELRKMPKQNPLLHDKHCPFRKHRSTGKYSGSNALTLSISQPGILNITDHQHAATLHSALWNELTVSYLEPNKLKRWKSVKEWLQLIAESIKVNETLCIKFLTVVVPKQIDNLTSLNLLTGRIVICELLYANRAANNAIILKAKGILNDIWLSSYRVEELNQKTYDLLLARKNDIGPNKKRILLMTLINSNGNRNNLSCCSLSVLTVNKNSFERL